MQQILAVLVTYTKASGQDLVRVPVDCQAVLAQARDSLHVAITESSATFYSRLMRTLTKSQPEEKLETGPSFPSLSL